MEDYKKLYLEIFNDITDLIEGLKEIQREAEELFISSNEEAATVNCWHTQKWLTP